MVGWGSGVEEKTKKSPVRQRLMVRRRMGSLSSSPKEEEIFISL